MILAIVRDALRGRVENMAGVRRRRRIQKSHRDYGGGSVDMDGFRWSADELRGLRELLVRC